MKVIHVTNLYPYEDHSTYGIFIKEQIDSLKDKDFQDVFFINAKEKGLKTYFKAIKDLQRIISNYDIIHCHHQFSAITAYLANPKAKIITAVLGDIKKRTWTNKVAYNIAEKISEKIIFKNQIPFPSDKYVLLPNGVNIDFFKELEKKECRKALNLDQDKIYVLFVCNGSLDNPIKRHDKFLKVIKKLNENNVHNQYMPLYLSNVKREEVPVYFNAADFMLLTSDHEGSPNAIKEAMACNVPIVSTQVGDVEKLLDGVNNSYISKKGLISELYQFCKQLDVRQKSNGRQRLVDLNLDSQSVAIQLVKLYNSL